MNLTDSVRIEGKEGLRGVGTPTRGRFGTDRMMLVKLEPEGEILVPALLFEPQEDGSLYLPVSLEDIKRHHSYGYHATTADPENEHFPFANGRMEAFAGKVPHPVGDAALVEEVFKDPIFPAEPEAIHLWDEDEDRIPEREELGIGDKWTEKEDVVVKKTVREFKEFIDEPVCEETADIERVPINRIIEAPLPIRHEGDVTIIPVIEEVLEITKKLVLKEEIRVTRHRRERHELKEITIHEEEAHVEKVHHKSGAAPLSRASKKRKA